MDRSISTEVAQTNANGALWQAFPDVVGDMMKIFNSTGTAIEFRINQRASVQIASGSDSGFLFGIENGTKVEVRRVDQSNTQVTVQAHLYA